MLNPSSKLHNSTTNEGKQAEQKIEEKLEQKLDQYFQVLNDYPDVFWHAESESELKTAQFDQ